MKIVVAGGTGLIGEPLVRRLVARGDDVAVLSRAPQRVRAGRGLQWDGRTGGAWTAEVGAADAIVNLAGESIGAGRWTETRKRALVSSRLDATHALVEAIRSAPRAPVLVNASAVGYYGDRADEELIEESAKGSGFLSDLVQRWEAAAREAEGVARLVVLRFGVVLAPEGGALQKLLLPFRLGVGGPVGSGKQWMSWIDRDDAIAMIAWAIDSSDARGVYNATAPNPVRNADFGRALGRALHRPAFMPAPAFAMKLALGEMAGELLLGGQKVLPRRAQREGFLFRYADLDESLAHLL